MSSTSKILLFVILYMEGVYNYVTENPLILKQVMLQVFCIYILCYM